MLRRTHDPAAEDHQGGLERQGEHFWCMLRGRKELRKGAEDPMPTLGRVLRLSRLLALALHMEDLCRKGEAAATRALQRAVLVDPRRQQRPAARGRPPARLAACEPHRHPRRLQLLQHRTRRAGGRGHRRPQPGRPRDGNHDLGRILARHQEGLEQAAAAVLQVLAELWRSVVSRPATVSYRKRFFTSVNVRACVATLTIEMVIRVNKKVMA